MNYTMDEIIMAVATEFANIMKEEGFDTFAEMKKCYWWTTEDIMEEVEAVIEHMGTAYIDREDKVIRADTWNDDGIPFKDFLKQVNKEIKKEMAA